METTNQECRRIAAEIALFLMGTPFGRLGFHGGSYSDGPLVRTNDGNRYHIYSVLLNDKHMFDDSVSIVVELWSEVTGSFYACENDLTLGAIKLIRRKAKELEKAINNL